MAPLPVVDVTTAGEGVGGAGESLADCDGRFEPALSFALFLFAAGSSSESLAPSSSGLARFFPPLTLPPPFALVSLSDSPTEPRFLLDLAGDSDLGNTTVAPVELLWAGRPGGGRREGDEDTVSPAPLPPPPAGDVAVDVAAAATPSRSLSLSLLGSCLIGDTGTRPPLALPRGDSPL